MNINTSKMEHGLIYLYGLTAIILLFLEMLKSIENNTLLTSLKNISKGFIYAIFMLLLIYLLFAFGENNSIFEIFGVFIAIVSILYLLCGVIHTSYDLLL